MHSIRWVIFFLSLLLAVPSFHLLPKKLLCWVKCPLVPTSQVTSLPATTYNLSSLAPEQSMSREAATSPFFQTSHPKLVVLHKTPCDTLPLGQSLTCGGLSSEFVFPSSPAVAFHIFVPDTPPPCRDEVPCLHCIHKLMLISFYYLTVSGRIITGGSLCTESIPIIFF